MCGKVVQLESKKSEIRGRGWNLPAQVKELARSQGRKLTSPGMRGRLALVHADRNRAERGWAGGVWQKLRMLVPWWAISGSRLECCMERMALAMGQKVRKSREVS